MIRMDDPDKFYAFVTKTLQLPVAWPLATRGGVTSGAVGVGNTNIEGLWKKLLEPNRASAPGLWPVGDGPAIRVVRANENKLQGLIISVVSLPQAKAFLRERGLLGPVTRKRITIDSSKIQGLNIQLIENR